MTSEITQYLLLKRYGANHEELLQKGIAKQVEDRRTDIAQIARPLVEAQKEFERKTDSLMDRIVHRPDMQLDISPLYAEKERIERQEEVEATLQTAIADEKELLQERESHLHGLHQHLRVLKEAADIMSPSPLATQVNQIIEPLIGHIGKTCTAHQQLPPHPPTVPRPPPRYIGQQNSAGIFPQTGFRTVSSADAFGSNLVGSTSK